MEDTRYYYEIEACAIISRKGKPVVYDMKNKAQAETFATLTATIFGAAEVIYNGLGMQKPVSAVIKAENGNMVMAAIGRKAFLAAVGPASDIEKIDINEIIKGIREVESFD